MYKLIAFDLDDTLSPAKNPADSEMIGLLSQLLEKYKVAIITWWKFETIDYQIISQIENKEVLNNLFIFPTIWTRMYYYENWDWKLRYSHDLDDVEVEKISLVLGKAIADLNLQPDQVWWEIVENRWSQVTYSALWQQAPLEVKRIWDPDKKIRQEIYNYIKNDLDGFTVWIAWTTSIDITKKGLDKAYGIDMMIENLHVKKEEILFMWDALFPGGNDFPVMEAWVTCRQVTNPEDTKKIIIELLD